LSLKRMISDRADKARRALGSMLGFLNRRRVPAYLKRPLVSTVLLHIATYGCELWGMSTSRAAPLGRVVDCGVLAVLGCSGSYCRAVAYKELGLPRVHVRAAKARCRGFFKWRSSRTRAGELVSTMPGMRNSTWCSGTQRWMSKYSPAALAPARLRARVVEVERVLVERSVRNDHSVVRRFRQGAGIAGRFPHPGLMLMHQGLHRGWSALMRLRIGSFQFAPRLVNIGVLSSEFREACPCCGEQVREDVEHLLLTCGAWRPARARHLLGF
jgi:hypothetical protein